MADRKNLFQRVGDFFGGIAKRIRGEPSAPPVPPPPPPAPPVVERRPPEPPPQPPRPEVPMARESDLDNSVHHISGYKVPHKARVLSRYRVGGGEKAPGTAGLRRMMDRARSGKSHFTFVITGVYGTDYPGKEGENEITLSYAVGVNTAYDALDDYSYAQDWLNDLLESRGEQWDDVTSIDIIDY